MVTKQFDLELGPHQIRVNSFNPTRIITGEMYEQNINAELVKSLDDMTAVTPLRRFCTMKECADPIMYLLSDHSSMVTGTSHVADGGLFAHIPV